MDRRAHSRFANSAAQSNVQTKMNDPNGPTLHYDRMIELNEFYRKASELFGPYIQAHQKV